MALLARALLLLAAAANAVAAAKHPRLPAAAAVVNAGEESAKPFTVHYFPQQLDHFAFTPNSSLVFRQKYLLNDTYWNRGGGGARVGPMFVYTGNEGDIEWFATNTGFMFDIAPEFGALLVFIEHRFYGESLPFADASYDSAATLGYLTSTQALADFAVVIRSLKKNLSAEAAPVVVFGGSYGGMLAAWFRLKYPHWAIGALASSAPILYFDTITPSTAFYDAVAQDFKDESVNCYEVIRGCWSEIYAEGDSKAGLAALSSSFRACTKVEYVESFASWLEQAFIYTAMVDYPTPANFMAPMPAYPVSAMCRIIDGLPASRSKLSRAFEAAAGVYYNYTGEYRRCFPIEQPSDPHGLHGWDWQACTEMVMPMSVSDGSILEPYQYNYTAFEEACMAAYGVRPRPHWITTEYGGYRIEQVLKRFGSNIIFSNGMRDPWSRGGVLKNISSTIVALVTEKGAHHVDLRYATKDDPDWLVQQRKEEIRIIKGWIEQYYQDLSREYY